MNDNQEELKLTAERYVYSNGGLCKSMGRIIFVPKLFPNEEGVIRIIGKKKGILKGSVIELLKPSPHRISPPCELYDNCGGCWLLSLDYDYQIKIKFDMLTESFANIVGIDISSIYEGITPSPKALYYRNKMEFTFTPDGFLGLHKAGEINQLVKVNECKLASLEINRTLKYLSEFVNRNNLPIYNPQTREGNLRYATIRSSFADKSVMLTLTLREPFDTSELYDYLNSKGCNVKSGYFFVNPHPIHSAQGDVVHIYGDEYIEDSLSGIRIRISPTSFLQINPLGAILLYKGIKEYLEPTGDETVIDLYSGIGSIGMFLAGYVKSVIGVENIESAVDDARINSERNGIQNTVFRCENVRKWLYFAVQRNESVDSVIIDPPRSGLIKKVIDRIKALKPEKIIYVSCNPESLARDIKDFTPEYKIKRIRAYDMFPQTYHMESLVLLVPNIQL